MNAENLNRALIARWAAKVGQNPVDIVNEYEHTLAMRAKALCEAQLLGTRGLYRIAWISLVTVSVVLVRVGETSGYIQSASNLVKACYVALFFVAIGLGTIIVSLDNGRRRREAWKSYEELDEKLGRLAPLYGPAQSFVGLLEKLTKCMVQSVESMSIGSLMSLVDEDLRNRGRGIALLWEDNPLSFVDGPAASYLEEFSARSKCYAALDLVAGDTGRYIKAEPKQPLRKN